MLLHAAPHRAASCLSPCPTPTSCCSPSSPYPQDLTGEKDAGAHSRSKMRQKRKAQKKKLKTDAKKREQKTVEEHELEAFMAESSGGFKGTASIRRLLEEGAKLDMASATCCHLLCTVFSDHCPLPSGAVPFMPSCSFVLPLWLHPRFRPDKVSSNRS